MQKIQKPHPDGGLWTGRKVAAWVSKETKTCVSHVTGWHYLRRLGFTIQVPRPSHAQAASIPERGIWKKNA